MHRKVISFWIFVLCLSLVDIWKECNVNIFGYFALHFPEKELVLIEVCIAVHFSLYASCFLSEFIIGTFLKMKASYLLLFLLKFVTVVYSFFPGSG